MANTGLLRDWKWFWDTNSDAAKNQNTVNKTSLENLTIQQAKDNYYLKDQFIDPSLPGNEMIANDSIQFQKFKGGFNEITNAAVSDISKGNIYVVGNFTSCHGFSCGRIVKLYLPGFESLSTAGKEYASIRFVDKTFTTGVGFNNEVKFITGRYSGLTLTGLYVGGDFTSYNGIPCSKIVCLDLYGNIDTSFNVGSGFDSTVFTIINSPLFNGTIYVGGSFTTYKGIQQKYLVQLDPNGNKTSTFTQTNFPGIVFAINFFYYDYANPRYLMFIGGFFNYTDYRNRQGSNLVVTELSGIDLNRYNDSLLVNPVYKVNGPVYCINVFPIDHSRPIFIGGAFTKINNDDHINFANLSWSGYNVDRYFNIGGEVHTITHGFVDNTFLVGGSFQTAGLKFVKTDPFNMINLNNMFLLDNGQPTNTSPDNAAQLRLKPINDYGNRGLWGGSVLHVSKSTPRYFFCSGGILEATRQYEKSFYAGYIGTSPDGSGHVGWHYDSSSLFSEWFNPDNA